MDNLTKEQRTKTMKAIKSRDSVIELKLRKALWKAGYRYRKNVKGLPGTPDITLSKYRIAIFCDSDFWHGYDWRKNKERIKSNREYWYKKIEDNMDRDITVGKNLKKLGWNVIRFWGHDIEENIEYCIKVVNSRVEDYS